MPSKNVIFLGDFIYTLSHFLLALALKEELIPLTIFHSVKDKGIHGGRKILFHESGTE